MGIIGRMHLEQMNRTLATRLAQLTFLSAIALVSLGSPRIVCAAAAYQNSNPGAITINDNTSATPYPSEITFAGVVGNITKVTVTLTNISHTEPSDIDIMLVSPGGSNAVILSDAGNAVAANNVTITLDDDAAAPPPFAAGLSSGTFQPVDYDPPAFPLADPDNFIAPAPAPSANVALATFNGENPNGIWQLWVVDSAATDTGSIAGGWTLTITTDAPTAARVVKFGGKRYQDGRVLLKWDTNDETNNLGFRIYRDAGRGPEPMTDGLVAGAALQLREAILSSEQSYTWSDKLEDDVGAVQYLLRDVDVRGHGGWHGPIAPDTVAGAAPDAQPATLLSQVGQRLRTAAGAVALPAGPRRGPDRSDLSMQQALAAQPAVKISVNQKGWYWVSYEALVEAGLPPTADPRSLRLYRHGREVAIQVRSALPDRFGAGDRIEFYGEGQDTPNTDTSVYWLTAGNGVGLRVPILDRRGEPGGATSFRATVEWRPRGVYFAGLLNGDAPNFFGLPVLSTPLEHSLPLAGVDPNPPGEALLEVALQGVSDVDDDAAGHNVVVSVNGIRVGEIMFKGQARHEARFPLAQELLQEVGNIITLQAQGAEPDVSLVDYVRVTYWHTYTVELDHLVATVETGGRRRGRLETQTITGFTSEDVRVFDVTNSERVQELVGQVVAGDDYEVTVAVEGRGPQTLLALTGALIKSPVSVIANAPSQWHAATEGAQLLIITHATFAEAARTLQAQRQAEGLSVEVVDIEDVYDEFGLGDRGPAALKAFLQHAWERWDPQPRYVLLLGHATFDPRNYLGHGSPDLVPTKLVDTQFIETASDDWLVDVDDDDLPDMAVGRLPVRTAEDARAVVNKLVAYAQQGGALSDLGALLVSDRTDVADFKAMNGLVRRQLPNGMGVAEVWRQEVDDTTARQRIIEQITAGVSFLSYAGHGSSTGWRGDLLTGTAARDLANGRLLPVAAAMTCLNGYSHHPVQESLAEALLLAESGGAVAVLASSGMTYAAPQLAFVEVWARGVFSGGANGQRLTLGEAVLQAKAATSDRDVRRTYTLFGDPAQLLAR